MALPKYKDIAYINTIAEINDEIIRLKKSLFKLRSKKSINQPIKPHIFSHTKRKIAQLNFRKSSQIKP